MGIITLPMRLHLNLIAMHNCSLRKNGGIGMSITTGNEIVEFYKGIITEINVIGTTNDSNKIEEILHLLDKIKDSLHLHFGVKIYLKGDYLFHCGLGTGTSVTLACVEALLSVNNVALSESEIITLSERGGTSGIGIRTYFNGGLILEAGVSPDNDTHAPSAYIKPTKLPTVITRCNIDNWKLGVIIPRNSLLLHSNTELDFFKKTCPIPANEAHYACYLSTFGIMASALEGNYNLFCRSINETKNTFWKRNEIDLQPQARSIMRRIYELGADCVGMSSMGGGIYYFADNPHNIGSKICKELESKYLDVQVCNKGREICLN